MTKKEIPDQVGNDKKPEPESEVDTSFLEHATLGLEGGAQNRVLGGARVEDPKRGKNEVSRSEKGQRPGRRIGR